MRWGAGFAVTRFYQWSQGAAVERHRNSERTETAVLCSYGAGKSFLAEVRRRAVWRWLAVVK